MNSMGTVEVIPIFFSMDTADALLWNYLAEPELVGYTFTVYGERFFGSTRRHMRIYIER